MAQPTWFSRRSSRPPTLDEPQRPQVAPVAVLEIEGIDHQLAAPASHAQVQAVEVGDAAGAGQAQLGVDDRRPAGSARQRGHQARQASGPLVAASAVEPPWRPSLMTCSR
jgi:hypothetical protein